MPHTAADNDSSPVGRRAAVATVCLAALLAGCGGDDGGAAPGTTTPSYTVGGSLAGLVSGRRLTLRNGGESLALTGNGAFSFDGRVAEGAAYDVIVALQPQGQQCSVERGQGRARANVADIAVRCTEVPVATYRVGGTVSGLRQDGSILVLRNNRLDFLDVAVNGSIRFNTPLFAGDAYEVVVDTLPTGQRCEVRNGSGVIAAADVTDVEVVCTTAPVAPAGGVQGLAGGWLNAACTALPDGRSARELLVITRLTDTSMSVAASRWEFADATCGAVQQLGAFAPASEVVVRRTESTAATTATWSHEQTSTGALRSNLWHRTAGDRLCRLVGNVGDATDPEGQLPTAQAAEAYFAALAPANPACHTPQR